MKERARLSKWQLTRRLLKGGHAEFRRERTRETSGKKREEER